MSLWKFFEIPDILRERHDRQDPETDQSSIDNNYPNYDVIPNYNYKPELIPGYHLLIGGSYGFLGGVFIGLPYISRKYRKLGYREWKLMEMMCLPLIKCSLSAIILGIGCGSLLELRRIANQDFNNNYNKKVF